MVEERSGNMKHEEYMRLRNTPFNELSEEDQLKRKTEFSRRLNIAKNFMDSIQAGRIDEEFTDLMEDDDPMKEGVEMIKININDNIGAKA